MAVNIDTVYQKVLAFANKEQRGYITPQEFNLYADQAQKEIFEQYFYDLDQRLRMTGNSEEYSDIIHNINEKIAIFEETTSITGSGAIVAIDLYRLGTVTWTPANGFEMEIEEVQQNELLYMNQANLTRPTADRRVYVRLKTELNLTTLINESKIRIYPIGLGMTTANVNCTYIRKPLQPAWGYFVIGDKALYDPDPSKTTNFELHPAEESELVYRILAFAGISMEKPGLTQAAVGMETTKVQQEKQ